MKLQTREHIYTKAEIEEMRANLIELRDGALSQGVMQWAVFLSHVIVVLALVIEEVEE